MCLVETRSLFHDCLSVELILSHFKINVPTALVSLPAASLPQTHCSRVGSAPRRTFEARAPNPAGERRRVARTRARGAQEAGGDGRREARLLSFPVRHFWSDEKCTQFLSTSCFHMKHYHVGVCVMCMYECVGCFSCFSVARFGI